MVLGSYKKDKEFDVFVSSPLNWYQLGDRKKMKVDFDVFTSSPSSQQEQLYDNWSIKMKVLLDLQNACMRGCREKLQRTTR